MYIDLNIAYQKNGLFSCENNRVWVSAEQLIKISVLHLDHEYLWIFIGYF